MAADWAKLPLPMAMDRALLLHHVTVAGDDEGFVASATASSASRGGAGRVGAPVLGHANGGALQVALMGLQFGLKRSSRVKASACRRAKPASTLPPL